MLASFPSFSRDHAIVTSLDKENSTIVRSPEDRPCVRLALLSVALVSCNRAAAPAGDAGARGGTEAPAAELGQGPAAAGTPRAGYYRHPAIHGDTVLFTSEGDLWLVGIEGGAARRLTSGAGAELFASISPDGHTVAFTASYEGPKDVYTMPVGGGVPRRLTWDGEGLGSESKGDEVAGWTPDGRVLVRTWRYSTLPDSKLVAFDLDGNHEVIPLAQASEGVYAPDGKTLFFTRLPKQSSQTKRYAGGTAENLWRYEPG
jgi:tricorn protease-like protein